MQTKALAERTEHPLERLHVRVTWLCGVVLFLEGYDIASVGYAIPSLVDVWGVPSPGFTQALTAGNVGLLLGSLCAGLLGDRLGRKPVLLSCVAGFGIFSLLSALVSSPLQLAALRLLTGLGLGGGIPLAIALVSDFSPPLKQGRLCDLDERGHPNRNYGRGIFGEPACSRFRLACDLCGRWYPAARNSAFARAVSAGIACPDCKAAPEKSGRGAIPG